MQLWWSLRAHNEEQRYELNHWLISLKVDHSDLVSKEATLSGRMQALVNFEWTGDRSQTFIKSRLWWASYMEDNLGWWDVGRSEVRGGCCMLVQRNGFDIKTDHWLILRKVDHDDGDLVSWTVTWGGKRQSAVVKFALVWAEMYYHQTDNYISLTV